MEADRARMGIAFGLVVLAGLCAPLGACVVVFMRTSHTGLLAASIALAAGVMVFISLTEVSFPGSSSFSTAHQSGSCSGSCTPIFLLLSAAVIHVALDVSDVPALLQQTFDRQS